MAIPRIVLCGKNLLAEALLRALTERGRRPVAYFHAPSWQGDPAGTARALDIPVYEGNVSRQLNLLAGLRPDVLLSLQYPHLIRPPVLDLAGLVALNVHFGALPRYGGCYPIAWAILNGEPSAGVTVHYMSATFDSGDIALQRLVPIDAASSARALYDRLTDEGVKLALEAVERLEIGTLPRRPQSTEDRLYFDRHSLDFARDSVMRWDVDTATALRRIRAFTFPPFQLPSTDLGGKRYEILDAWPARPDPERRGMPPAEHWEAWECGQSEAPDLICQAVRDGWLGLRVRSIAAGAPPPPAASALADAFPRSPGRPGGNGTPEPTAATARRPHSKELP